MGRNTSITLGDHFARFVDTQVADGRYGSASEVVRAGLRLLEDHANHVAAVRAALTESVNSGEPEQFVVDGLLAWKRAPCFEAQRTKTTAAPEFAHYSEQWHFSPVVDVGGFVFLAGQTDARADGTVLSDPEAQFREAFTSLGKNLSAAGLGLSDIVEMTTYHVGLRRHLDLFIKVKDEHMREPYPAWTAIGVNELITPGTIVEIRAIARRTRS